MAKLLTVAALLWGCAVAAADGGDPPTPPQTSPPDLAAAGDPPPDFGTRVRPLRNHADLEKTVYSSTRSWVLLVTMLGNDCPPCEAIKPKFAEAAAASNGAVSYALIEVDQSSAKSMKTVTELGITAAPALLMYAEPGALNPYTNKWYRTPTPLPVGMDDPEALNARAIRRAAEKALPDGWVQAVTAANHSAFVTNSLKDAERARRLLLGRMTPTIHFDEIWGRAKTNRPKIQYVL